MSLIQEALKRRREEGGHPSPEQQAAPPTPEVEKKVPKPQQPAEEVVHSSEDHVEQDVPSSKTPKNKLILAAVVLVGLGFIFMIVRMVGSSSDSEQPVAVLDVPDSERIAPPEIVPTTPVEPEVMSETVVADAELVAPVSSSPESEVATVSSPSVDAVDEVVEPAAVEPETSIPTAESVAAELADPPGIPTQPSTPAPVELTQSSPVQALPAAATPVPKKVVPTIPQETVEVAMRSKPSIPRGATLGRNGVESRPVPVASTVERSPDQPPPNWPLLKITGVMARSTSSKSSAVIDNRMFVLGEVVDGVRIIEIRQTGVLLEFAGQKKFVRVGHSTDD